MVDREQTNPGNTPLAGSSSGTRSGGTAGTGGDLKQQAGQMADQVKDQALQLKDKVAETTTGAIEGHKEQATSGLGDVTATIRKTGDQLRSQDQDRLAQYVDQAADQLDRFTGYLRGRDVREIVGDVERFARREPTLFLGGAFVLGLLGARFLKSSTQAIDEGSESRGYLSYRQPERGYGTSAALSSYSSYNAMPHTQPYPVQPAASTAYRAADEGRDYPAPQASGGMNSLGTGGSLQPNRTGGVLPAAPSRAAATPPGSTTSGSGAPDWDRGATRSSGLGARETTPGSTPATPGGASRSRGDAGA